MLLSVTFPLDMELKPCHFSDDNNSSSDRLSVEVKGDFNDDLSDSGQVDSEDEEANIEYGDYATIYRAVIRDADGTSTDVVLKCSHKNTQSDLIQEAVFYLNQLKPLQGIVVPKFYGLFHGIGPDDLEIVCILLEDCGKSVAVHFKELSLRDSTSILYQLIKIHFAGVIHGDFSETHVVEREGSFRIIDFHDAAPHEPTCNFQFKDNLRAGEPRPDCTYSGCSILWRTCLEFKIWDNGCIWIELAGMIFRKSEGWPCQEVVDELMPQCLFTWNDEVKHAVQEYFRLVQADLARGITIEELKEDANRRFLESKLLDPSSAYLRPQYGDA